MLNELNSPSLLNDDVDVFSVYAMSFSETQKDPRILGLLLSFEEKSILLLNLYFPTTGPNGEDYFSHYIGGITSLIAECDEENVSMIGDFNASPWSATFAELLSMC